VSRPAGTYLRAVSPEMPGSGGWLRQNTELPGNSHVVPVLMLQGCLPVADLHQLHAFELDPLAGGGLWGARSLRGL